MATRVTRAIPARKIGAPEYVPMEKKAVKRGTRGSRNKKKNMRKKVDISEVEEYLEEKRDEARTGGPVRDAPSDELFTVDKPSLRSGGAKPALSRKQRARAKTLKVDIIVAPSTKTKAVSVMKRREAVPGAGENLRIRRQRIKGAGRQGDERRRAREHEAIAERERVAKALAAGDAGLALWDVTGKAKSREMLPESHWLKPAETQPVKQPKLPRGPEASAEPTVPLPKQGTSYNPEFEAHQELLGEALREEQARIQSLKKAQRSLPKDLSYEEQQANLLKELGQGIAGVDPSVPLPGGDTEDGGEGAQDGKTNAADGEAAAAAAAEAEPILSEEEEEEPESDSVESGRRPTPRARTAAARRREKAQRDATAARRAAKAARAREAEVLRVRSITKDIKASEAASAARTARRQARAEAKRLHEPRRMSKYKYQRPRTAVQLTSELVGNLRQLRPEGNVMSDRMDNLVRRNIVEARVKLGKHRRRYKLKEYEKRSYKNFDLKERINREARAKAKAKADAARARK